MLFGGSRSRFGAKWLSVTTHGTSTPLEVCRLLKRRGGYFRPDEGGGGGDGLYGRLLSGDVPAWLSRVPLDEEGTGGFLLFEVVRGATGPGL